MSFPPPAGLSASASCTSGLNLLTSQSSAQLEDKTEEWGNWISEILMENPQLLALRERILPWSGGHSFANIVHTDTTTSDVHVNRFTILELIFQYLNAIGMHETADILQSETGHQFQLLQEPWDRTDLHLLVSMAVGVRENPWVLPDDPHHKYINEEFEEDSFACGHREDPLEIYKELLDGDRDKKYWTKQSSLRRFIACIVDPDTELTDDELNKRLLVLHSFTSSHHFFIHLKTVFHLDKLSVPDEFREQRENWMKRDYRKTVLNIIRNWVNWHGLFIGKRTLKSISHFFRKCIEDADIPDSYKKWIIPALKRLPTLTYGKTVIGHGAYEFSPEIPNARIIFRPSLTLIEPEPIEVARQISLIFHNAFRTIHPREFFIALVKGKCSQLTPVLAEFYSYGKNLKYIVLETIALATDKSAAVHRVLEIAKRLREDGNFSALACIIKALKRLDRQKVEIVTNDKDVQKRIRRLGIECGMDRVGAEKYMEIVQERYSTVAVTIPNLKVEIASFARSESPSFIDNEINWEHRTPIADKIHMFYTFQNNEYRYYPVSQIQKVITREPTMSRIQLAKCFQNTSH